MIPSGILNLGSMALPKLNMNLYLTHMASRIKTAQWWEDASGQSSLLVNTRIVLSLRNRGKQWTLAMRPWGT